MSIFVDVAFPTAVRRVFTYHLPPGFKGELKPGIRIWVPLRNYFAIGVITAVHQNKPAFKTKAVKQLLDDQPILSEELLTLLNWISRFYYCSLGESIQAALPVGLNYISRKKPVPIQNLDMSSLTKDEKEVISELKLNDLNLDDAKKRWKGTRYNKVLNALVKNKKLEIWEFPDVKVSAATEREWDWERGKNTEAAKQFLQENSKNTKWMQALQSLSEAELPKKQSELFKTDSITPYTISKLKEEGWVDFREVEKKIIQNEQLEFDPSSVKNLNEDQQIAAEKIIKSIRKNEFASYLLYGVTGSGKTEVYIHALQQAVEANKGGIVLVPEIALTPQTVSRFYRVFGDQIAVLHSRMSSREKLQAWKDLRSGEKTIAIGPRSAVFAPVKNPGLIILDEEHDPSYKQMDPSPRYHARETAIMRAKINNAVIVMGSATPSLQALHMCAKGKCKLLELKSRHAKAKMPEVEVLDLTQYKNAMHGELAVPLYMAIKDALQKKEQVILLYNRRGYANFMQCEDCGHIPQSPECAVSLTYHKRKNELICHYSGYARRADTHCENCGSSNLVIRGSGTQNVEEQLEQLFPDASILRFDRDSTSRKGSHEKILSQFGEGKADILIGTQLVAKGLDFPNVTVVGIINADTELAFPSFQAKERMYQLLSQVAGRSGRGEKAGKVFLQTRNADNAAIIYAKKHNHKGFARHEIEFRKPLYYPPYSRLISITFKSPKEPDAHGAAHLVKQCIDELTPNLPVLGPSPAAIPWMNRKFIWELTLKIDTKKGADYIEALLDTIMNRYEQYAKNKFNSVRINVNVDSIH